MSATVALGARPAGAVAGPRRLADEVFTLGVASGDPEPHGVVLWTRLAPRPMHADGGMPATDVPVRWQVATDERFRHVVRSGTALAPARLAHSVHVEVDGLEPARTYFYRFRAAGSVSPVGRTRTTPPVGARLQRLRFAFASCQKWQDGYYPAYGWMAEEDLDLVVHLGDYLYEYGIPADGGYRKVPVPDEFRTETTTLDRYRLQYGLYKSDPDLQAAHAAFPWVLTWDDHEVDNDYAGLDPEGTAGDRDAFLLRRAAAYQAYYEHLPLRRAAMPALGARMYRRIRYGDLANFQVLDTRQYRGNQPCGDGETPRCAAALDPAVTMTGPAQERWLLAGLDASRARWNVIAQQVMMGQLDHDTGPNQRFWNDGWDGYPMARARILRHVASRGTANPVVLSGDWHSTFVNDLKLDFDDPASATVATEFVGTSVSSGGDAQVFGPYYGPMIPSNPHIRFFDGDRRGYVRCVVGRRTWHTDLRMVTTVSRRDAPAYTLASFVVEDGRPGATRVG